MDIQKLAKEYKKLQQYNYVIGIDNGEIIKFKFTDNDFYHLLGFEKFQNSVTVVKMVEDRAYSKSQFYKNVLRGKITFYETKIVSPNINTYLDNGKVVNFCDAGETDKTRQVLNRRFPYFSYNNIMMLLRSQLIILYDKEKAKPWNKVDADKIFFKLLTMENRNLNFFVRKAKESEGDCPVSFFLEEEKDTYLKTKPGCIEKEQIKAEMTFRAIRRKGTNIYEDFAIYWDKVRFKYSKEYSGFYTAQLGLQEYFQPKEAVQSAFCKEHIQQVENRKVNLIKRLEEFQIKIDLLEQYELYQSEKDSDKKDLLAIEILEKFDFNVEEDILDLTLKKRYVASVNEAKNTIAHENKILKKYQKHMHKLYGLEKEEIILIYKNFIPEIEKYEDDFFIYLADTCDIFKKSIIPTQIEDMYLEFKSIAK